MGETFDDKVWSLLWALLVFVLLAAALMFVAREQPFRDACPAPVEATR